MAFKEVRLCRPGDILVATADYAVPGWKLMGKLNRGPLIITKIADEYDQYKVAVDELGGCLVLVAPRLH